MARKVITEITSDLSGKKADETITFGLDGASYEIDLTKTEAGKMRDAVALFVAGARRVGGRHSPKKIGNAKAVREWAKSQGLNVPDRGRIPTEVMDSYQRAH